MEKRVALIHDWLNGMRGGERVLQAILELFPTADIFTLFLEREKISQEIKSHRIFPSLLNKHKFIRKRYRRFLPFFPATIEQFNVKQYELVISSSHCVAKGVIPSPGATHISYVFSPMRYIWDQYESYFGSLTGLKKSFIKYQISKLRTWDIASSARVDYFVAISSFVRQRIWKYYRRDASIIHPPVDVDFFQPAENPEKKYFLTVSALVPYKNIGLVINTFNESGDRLIIVGDGQEEKKLKKIARSNIEFKKNVSRQELKSLYQNAISLVFAGIEDFGIAFVEAQACGIPVVAYRQGGVLDIVKEGKTGILFENQNVTDIIKALERVKKEKFQSSVIRDNSLKFSKENFKIKFKNLLGEILK